MYVFIHKSQVIDVHSAMCVLLLSHFAMLKVDLPICEIFRNKKTQLFNYYLKTKGFYF